MVDFVTDFDQEPAYVGALSASRSGERLFAGCTRGLVHELDPRGSEFKIIQQFGAHSGSITEIVVHPTDESLLFTSSNDKTVRLWDIRAPSSTRAAASFTSSSSSSEPTKKPELQLSAPKKVLSCSPGGGQSRTLVAACILDTICVWDVRLPEYREVGKLSPHSDHISSIKFHPHKPHMLYSSAFDGLVCGHDTGEIQKREDCLTSVLPIGEPVRDFGFLGKEGNLLQSMTSNHNASIWKLATEEPIVRWSGLREKLTADLNGTVQIDYLAQFFQVGEQVLLLCGSYSGDAAVWRLTTDKTKSAVPVLQPFTALVAGHQAPIRAAVWNVASHIYTAGEDARIARWSFNPSTAPASSSASSSRRVVASRGIEDDRHGKQKTVPYL